MDNYNLANISKISDSTSSTYREQVSQLGLENKVYLHSTFSYPLHSTVSNPHQTMDVSLLQETSAMIMKLNQNLPESQLNATVSSTDSGHCTNHSSDSFIMDTQADESMIDWGSESDSDCDSSCLSFDVDDLSFCVDDSTDAQDCHMPLQSLEKKCYINDVIHNQIGVQMWGDDYTVCSDSTQGDCDVCNLLRMKRQRASTDLRFDGRKPDNLPLFSHSNPELSSYLCDHTTSVNTQTSSHNKCDTSTSMKNQESSKLRKSGSCVASVMKKVLKPSMAHKYKKSLYGLSPKEKLFRKSLETMRSCDRLHPEGIEANESHSPVLSPRNHKPLVRCPKRKSLQEDMQHGSGSVSGKISPLVSDRNISKRRSGAFCESLPTPSPWRGDKKSLIKRLKTHSQRKQCQVQNMGCV